MHVNQEFICYYKNRASLDSKIQDQIVKNFFNSLKTSSDSTLLMLQESIEAF